MKKLIDFDNDKEIQAYANKNNNGNFMFHLPIN